MMCGGCEIFKSYMSTDGREEFAYELRAIIEKQKARYAEWYDPVIQEDLLFLRGGCLGGQYCSR